MELWSESELYKIDTKGKCLLHPFCSNKTWSLSRVSVPRDSLWGAYGFTNSDHTQIICLFQKEREKLGQSHVIFIFSLCLLPWSIQSCVSTCLNCEPEGKEWNKNIAEKKNAVAAGRDVGREKGKHSVWFLREALSNFSHCWYASVITYPTAQVVGQVSACKVCCCSWRQFIPWYKK